ncbi:MAG: hypothetical protein NT127_04935 [Sphingobacteriales bacterium]|nr:hypothetical protein [Sphingobacteriales bacterium]
MKDFQFITNSTPAHIESLYQDFVNNPNSIDQELRKFFEGFDFAVSNVANGKVSAHAENTISVGNLNKEFAVYQLIQAYRNRGHLITKTNPIRERVDRHANLEISNFGLTDADMNAQFQVANLLNIEKNTLKDIITHLQNCYTNHIGIDFSSINDSEKFNWLLKAFEKKVFEPISIEKKKRILQKLNEGVMFEKFLHTKYIGQKRFSLEGGETTIAALDAILNASSENDVEEVVIGMAHRGRLNVLANILGKTYAEIFNEFEGNALPDTTMGSGQL